MRNLKWSILDPTASGKWLNEQIFTLIHTKNQQILRCGTSELMVKKWKIFSSSRLATEFFMRSSHCTHFTPFRRVILAISFPYERWRLWWAINHHEIHVGAELRTPNATRPPPKRNLCVHHEYKIYDLIYIYTFLPKLIYTREGGKFIFPSTCHSKTEMRRKKKHFFFPSSLMLLTWLLPVGWTPDFSAAVVVAAARAVVQQVWRRWKLTFRAVEARRLSSNLSKINTSFFVE